MIKIICSWLLFTPVFASDQIPDVDMHVLAKEVSVLQKYMFSEAEFSAPNNESAIGATFPLLDKHLFRLKEKVFLGRPVLRTNVSMLADQINDVEKAFQEGHKSYARHVLVSSLQLCIACHTRMASADFILPDTELKGASSLEKANYYFATRQFETGRELYERFLANARKGEEPGLIRASALALVTYYARVKLDPKKGATYFSKQTNDKKFSAEQRKDFAAWSGALARWAKGEHKYEDSLSAPEALAEARRILKGAPRNSTGAVQMLRASSFLNAALETPGEWSAAKTEALIELAKIYESLDFFLYYRFGDMYLKACILENPKTKFAQDCYRTLDAFVKKRIAGGKPSGDTNMEEVDLFRWKKLAY